MKRLKPALEFKGFEVVGDQVPPSGNEVRPDNLRGVQDGSFGFGTDCARSHIVFQVMLGEGGKANPDRAAGVVDSHEQPQSVHFPPGVFRLWEVTHETNGQGVLNPFSVRVRDSVTQHPGIPFFARHFLE